MYSLLYAGRTERVDIDTTDSKAGKIRYGGEGGILTQSLSASYHLFSDIHDNRMDIGDFYDLAFCSCFNCSA